MRTIRFFFSANQALRFGSYLMSSLLCLVATPLSVVAQSGETHTISSTGIFVSGECLAKVAQDRGSVTLGSTAQAKAPKDASERATAAHEAIKKAVKNLSLPDYLTETADYSVSQECSYHEGKRICEGYRARIATRFETSDIARLGDIIGVGSQLSSQEISALSLFASPEKIKSSREACLEVAMRNAKAKAQTIAKGAGVTLGKLISVRESKDEANSQPYPMRSRSYEAVAMAEAAAPPTVDSRPIDLRVELVTQYGVE